MGIELIWIPRLDTFNTSLICEKNGFFVLNEKRFENNPEKWALFYPQTQSKCRI